MMHSGDFPNLNRYLRFESHDDYLRYCSGVATWPRKVPEAVNDLEILLDRKPAEQEIHTFFERHPYLLPGFGDLHHGPYEGIVATKLPLGNSFVTDFAYIASNSQTLTFTCIELESPRKRLFRADGRFHRDYLDARQQVTDWLSWANQDRKQALSCWGPLLSRQLAARYDINFRGFVVFGRRAEIDSPTKQERWSAEAASLDASISSLTYDRLLRNRAGIYYDVDNAALAVCSFRDRRFVVKSVAS